MRIVQEIWGGGGEKCTVRDVSVRSIVSLSPGELSATSATYPTKRNRRVLWFPCSDCDNSLEWGHPVSRGNILLRRCLKNCSHNSAGHNGTEGNRSETAVNSQECYNIPFRQQYRNNTPSTLTTQIIEDQYLEDREIGPSATIRTGTHNCNGMDNKDQAKVSNPLAPE